MPRRLWNGLRDGAWRIGATTSTHWTCSPTSRTVTARPTALTTCALLYEQKVKSPLSVTESGTGLLGGKAAFGNTADNEFDLILGAPARAEGGAAQIGVYDAALRAGHRVHPIVMEVFGGFHPDAAKLVDTLAKNTGRASAPTC